MNNYDFRDHTEQQRLVGILGQWVREGCYKLPLGMPSPLILIFEMPSFCNHPLLILWASL